jgi:protein subunit release factor B
VLHFGPVSHDRLQELELRLAELGVRPEDLVERFSRAGGPGGQHVNRTASAVHLRHEPTGIEVRAEGERSQLRNRIAAREQLIQRIESARAAAEAQRVQEQERARRQRRRPPPAARKKMVAHKRNRGAIKRQRGRVSKDEPD